MPKVRVDFLSDTGSLERGLRRASSAAKVFGNDFERAASKSEKAAKGLKGIRPEAGLAAGLAGAAVLSGIRSTIAAATDAQRVQEKLAVSVRNSGSAYADYAKQIDEVITRTSKLSGLDDEDLSEAFSNLVRTTKDVSEALKLIGTAADIARTKGIDLAAASSLLARVYAGNFRGLNRIGVAIKPVTAAQDRLRNSTTKVTLEQVRAAKAADANATRIQALGQVQRAFAGQAEAYGKSAAGAQDRLRVSIENVQEQIGSGLLPAVTTLADELSVAADNASSLVKALQRVKLPGGGGIPFGGIVKAGIAATPGLQIIAFENELRKRFGGNKAQSTATDAGKAFGEAFGLAALEAAGNAVTSKPLPVPFGQPGFKPGKAPAVPLGPSVEQRNTIFDNSISRALNRAGNLDTSKQLSALQKVSATLTQRIAVTKDITRKLNLEDQLIAVQAQQKDLRQQLAQDFTDALQFNVDKAGATKSLVDDLAALKRLEDNLKKRLAADKTNLDLQRQIFDVQQQEKDLVQQQRQNKIDRITSKQFRELGLGADGSAVTPGVANLKKRLGNFSEAVKGTFLDTSKTRTQLARFRKVLSESLVPKDVRSKFAEMLSDLEQQLKDHLNGPLTKTTQINSNRILQNVAGLSADQRRQIQANTSHFNSAGVALSGAGAMTLNVPVSIDGMVVAKASAKYNKRTKKLNPPQRNGPNARHF